jgi:predicted nucleic acid-binding protein
MAGIVQYASTTLPWRFGDEATPWTRFLLSRFLQGDQAVVPAHWPIEVTNALLVAKRGGRVTNEEILEFCSDLALLPIRIEPAYSPLEWAALMALAEQYGLTTYDAAYLDLSRRSGLLLATLDRDLEKAARAAGTPLIQQQL